MIASTRCVGAMMTHLLVCVFISAGLMVGQRSLDDAARTFISDHFSAAKQAEAREDFSGAAAEYQAIIAVYPDALPEVYQNLGIDYFLVRDYEAAIGAFQRGLKLRPDMAGAQLFLGGSYLFSARPRQAIPFLKAVHNRSPSAESATYLGLASKSLGRFSEAARYFRLALGTSTQKDNVLYHIGDCFQKLAENTVDYLSEYYPASEYENLALARTFDWQENYQLAAAEYMEAGKLDPANASIFFALARLLAIFDMDKASEMAYERYQRLVAPEAKLTLDRDGLPHRQMLDIGKKVDYETELRVLPKLSEHELRIVPSLDGSIDAALAAQLHADRTGKWKKAAQFLALGQWQEAIPVIQDIQTSEVWLRACLLAFAQISVGDYEGAEQSLDKAEVQRQPNPSFQLMRWEVSQQLSFLYFNRVLQEYPNSSRAHFVKAIMLESQRQNGVVEEYREAIAADPTQTEIRMALAERYLADSNEKDALELCEQELQLNRYSVSARKLMGRIYNEAGTPLKAVPLLKAALEADPSDPGIIIELARSQEMLGETQNAVDAYKRVLQLAPSLNRVHYALGRLYRELGQIELATRENKAFQENMRKQTSAYEARIGLGKLNVDGPSGASDKTTNTPASGRKR